MVNFEKVSTGALNDLEKVTKQAYAMISYYGMGEKVKNLSYYDSTGQSCYNFTKPYSEKTAEAIDEEVKSIVDEQYERAIKLLKENKEGLIKLGDLLREREVIFAEDLENVFGKRPWTSRADALEIEREKENKEKSVVENKEKSTAEKENVKEDKDDTVEEKADA